MAKYLHLKISPEDVLIVYSSNGRDSPILDPRQISLVIPDPREKPKKHVILIDAENDFGYLRYNALSKKAKENLEYSELKHIVDNKLSKLQKIIEDHNLGRKQK